jgi:hypothetical protein
MHENESGSAVDEVRKPLDWNGVQSSTEAVAGLSDRSSSEVSSSIRVSCRRSYSVAAKSPSTMATERSAQKQPNLRKLVVAQSGGET